MTKKLPLFSFIIIGIFTSFSQDIESDIILEIGFSNEIADLTNNAIPVGSGMETFVEDREGNASCAMSFNGLQDEYITVPMNIDNALQQGDEFTVSLWFKMNNTDMGNYESLFQKGSTSSDGFQMAVYDMNAPLISDAAPTLEIWDHDWQMDPDLPTDVTNWHHFVMVLETTSVRLYRDNVLRNTFDYTGNEFDIEPGMMDYKIGEFFIGALDDIRVYKRVLTETEVGMLYNLETICGLLNTTEIFSETVFILQPYPKTIKIEGLTEQKNTVEIFDVNGKKVFGPANINASKNILYLSEISGGVYILKLTTENINETLTKKIILE